MVPRQAFPFGTSFRHLHAGEVLRFAPAGLVALVTATLVWASGGPGRTGLPEARSALPAPASALVSAVLGRDDPRYGARSRPGAGITTANPRHGLTASFRPDGVRVDTPAGSLTLSVEAVARGEVVHRLAPARPTSRTNRVEYRRGPLTEWYVNGPFGLEQGFTLAAPPAPRSTGPLALHLDVGGTLASRLAGSGVVFARDGAPVVRYGGLAAWDAAGRPLASSLRLHGHRLVLNVDDRGARYPITVDPFLERATLRSSSAATADELGTAVAVSGNTIVAGAVGEAGQRGAAYVFVQPPGGWAGALSETAKLTPSDGVEGDSFGGAVAVSDTAVAVGAAGDDGSRGSVYVFVKPPAGWSGSLQESAKLTASSRVAGALLGYAVSLDGDTVAAGAPGESGGAAYVFVRPVAGWGGALTQNARLAASAGAASLGSSIAVSGVTVAAGAPGVSSLRGAVFVFSRPSTGWAGGLTESAVLAATGAAAGDQLGLSVSATSAVIVAGAPFAAAAHGAAYVFVRPAAGWSGQLADNAQLRASAGVDSEELGMSVSAWGDTVAVGSWGDDAFAGAVYVFSKPAGGWAGSLAETERLTVADAAAGDSLGGSVGFDGGTIVAGASADDADRGSARVFVTGAAGGDLDPPDVSITLAPTLPDGLNGWYRTPVHVTASAADPSGVAELRCVLDPAAPPSAFADLPTGCPFAGAGANVATDGAHAVYAGARDTIGNAGAAVSRTFKLDGSAPTVTCAAAPTFLLGGAGGAVAASVSDVPSGPAAAAVSAPADVSSVGWKSVALTGFDLAGNTRTVSCRYLVGYAVSFDSFPERPSGVHAGAAVPVRFALTDGAGSPIPDAQAQALAAACAVRVRLDGGAPGCAKYDATSDRFSYILKTPPSLAPGTHDVSLEVDVPGGVSSTVVPLLIR